MKAVRAIPVLLALIAAPAGAQYSYGYDSRTGDPTLDAVLDTINLLFNDEPDYTVDQIVYETQAAPIVIREYIIERHYAPADVYMIGELAQSSGQPFSVVAQRFDTHRTRGWGAIAKDLGIKPGSAQFHALKSGTTVFVDRGKAKHSKSVRPAGSAGAYPTQYDRHGGQFHQPTKSSVKSHGKGRSDSRHSDSGKARGKAKDKQKN